jgi:NAD(P)H-hydrate epimerase
VVDALLGTGVTRPVEGLLAAAIRSINQSRRPVLALDLPSGLDADTGQPQGVAIQSTATATFVAPKVGFEAPGASDYLGEVIALEIGVPRRILAPYLVD